MLSPGGALILLPAYLSLLLSLLLGGLIIKLTIVPTVEQDSKG